MLLAESQLIAFSHRINLLSRQSHLLSHQSHFFPLINQQPFRMASNRLAGEKSPYLLQHASNPVHWYPWGEEATRVAKEQDKPIFLSIGYSTCHWCHVMERESFESQKIADVLNRYFVSIKV